MKILVGLSGGVDSSVAALLLKKEGHEVIGATMSIWGKNGMAAKSSHKNACYGPDEKEDIEAAREIAKQIGIPYYVFDCVEQYERIVLENFKSEYIQGRTPNPCVWCNARVKFGVLPQIAKENGIDFDKFATGHYARVVEENGRFLLKRGIAPHKDQSYFLYRLKQEQLKNIILPLGNYTKDQIREIVDLHGKVLGTHKGIWNYTIGQRKGIGVSSTEPLYVLELKKDTNEVVIGPKDKTFKKTLIADNINWIAIEKLTEPRKATAKIRSTQQPTPVTLTPVEDGKIQVDFDEFQKSIAIGQSAVFYDEDTVLGGGVIECVKD